MNIRKFTIGIVAVSAIGILLGIQVAAAHLVGGQDIATDDGTYIIDFGYDPATPEAGGQTSLALGITERITSEPVPLTSIWTRITLEEEVLFAGHLAPQNNQALFTYVFPHDGDYDITARFATQGGEETTQNFRLNIEAPTNPNRVPRASLLIVAGFILVAFIAIARKITAAQR
ncbi:hypothetical protein COV82_05880 [Candidatus Peregrinibacteria bacterium CG11_big_fil_rev_8_21_14_0_20_46_8]|nr:MAG: hypothetical protein COV82_05880 [Candidatus Peregrinibacteria bacterium CG11_big_fil_rev_8_21_14_0_20_46_8]